MGKRVDARMYMQNLIAQKSLRGWTPDKPIDPDNQREVMDLLTEELCRSLEDCIKEKDYDRYDALMVRADHLMRAFVDRGYDLMRPMAEWHAAISHLMNRAERRFLIRKYLTNPDSVDRGELRKALDLYWSNSAEHREDLEHVHAKIKDPKFRMCGDIFAKAKAIAERPLHDEAYLRKLCGLDAK
jgi:hypothetical protein